MRYDKLIVATDGSCLQNPGGPTGWAWVTEDGRSCAGGAPKGTNQIGELYGVLTALREFPVEDLTIQIDSEYAMNIATRWGTGWARRGWRTAAGDPVKNLPLVKVIVHLMRTRPAPVQFEKVSAHDRAGRWPLNDKADLLAKAAAKRAGSLQETFFDLDRT